MSLLADDTCRVCFHGPHGIPCTDIEETPTPDGVDKSVCGCTEYVDLEAESRIMVRKRPPANHANVPLAAALHATARKNHNLGEGPMRSVCLSAYSHETRASAILAALPPDAHLFTVDSLAAALLAANIREYDQQALAAAIIKAAKEASE